MILRFEFLFWKFVLARVWNLDNKMELYDIFGKRD